MTTVLYLKHEIVDMVREILGDISGNRQRRIVGAQKLFYYLAQEKCKQFMNDYPKFKAAVVRKLHELYVVEGLIEARTWFSQMFDARMPLDVEQWLCETQRDDY